ncbi:MAG: GDSL-type esterase/lipase family protein, partial [Flavobacteriaceae bacterium]
MMKNVLYGLLGCLFFSCSIPDNPTNYLALGDSYTIGEGVNASERWPVQLMGDLKEMGYMMDSLQIIARTGWTTDELLIGALESSLLSEYDLVTVMIGVNNQFRGRSL